MADELWRGTAEILALGALVGWRARGTRFELDVGAGPELSAGREVVHRYLPVHGGNARSEARLGYGMGGVRVEVRLSTAMRREATMDGQGHVLAGHFVISPLLGYTWSF